MHKSRLIFIKSIDEDKRHSKEKALIRKVEQDIVRKTFVDMDGLRTSVYASLVRYLEEKEYIRWKPFDAACDNGATLEDLDEGKMKNFIHMARSKRNFPLSVETPPVSLLTHLNLIDDHGRIANAALLLFGKKPQKYFISSEIKCVQFYGNVIEKPMPANPLLADPMYWNGYIEKVGTGTEDIINKCKEYGLKTPKFCQEEDFKVVIWRARNIQDKSKRSKSDPNLIQI